MKSSLILTISVAAGVFGLVLWYGMRTAKTPTSIPAAAPSDVAASRANVVATGVATSSPASPASPASAASAAGPSPDVPAVDAVARWTADANSGDAAKRAAAIAALGHAPKAQALPLLARVVTDGEPTVDRKLALRALRDLAAAQGDADGAIRDAVRAVIYHGDDYAPVAEAQEALDAIEAGESSGAK